MADGLDRVMSLTRSADARMSPADKFQPASSFVVTADAFSRPGASTVTQAFLFLSFFRILRPISFQRVQRTS